MLSIKFDPTLLRDPFNETIVKPAILFTLSIPIPVDEVDNLIKLLQQTGTMAIMAANAERENPPTPEQVDGELMAEAAEEGRAKELPDYTNPEL